MENYILGTSRWTCDDNEGFRAEETECSRKPEPISFAFFAGWFRRSEKILIIDGGRHPYRICRSSEDGGSFLWPVTGDEQSCCREPIKCKARLGSLVPGAAALWCKEKRPVAPCVCLDPGGRAAAMLSQTAAAQLPQLINNTRWNPKVISVPGACFSNSSSQTFTTSISHQTSRWTPLMDPSVLGILICRKLVHVTWPFGDESHQLCSTYRYFVLPRERVDISWI